VNFRLERPLLAALDALSRCKLDYAIIGGLAVGIWARPRATDDIDLWAQLPDGSRKSLQRALEARDFEVPDMEGELRHFGVFRSKHLTDDVFLDIFDAGNPLGMAILAHRKRVRVYGKSLWFVRAEELAVLKAIADRPKDFEDLVAVLRGSKPNAAEISRWTTEVDRGIGSTEVTERFEKAKAEARRKQSPRRAK
jgi:predicted nucleotidyltransferase